MIGLFSRGGQEDLQRSSYYGIPSNMFVPNFIDSASWYLGYVTARYGLPLRAATTAGALQAFGHNNGGLFQLSQASLLNVNQGFEDGNAAAGLGGSTTPNVLPAPDDGSSSSGVTYNADLINAAGVLSNIAVSAGPFPGSESVAISLSDGVSDQFGIMGNAAVQLDITGTAIAAASTGPALMIGGDGASLTGLGADSVFVLTGSGGSVSAGNAASIFVGGNDNGITAATSGGAGADSTGLIVVDGQDDTVSADGLTAAFSSAATGIVGGLGDATIFSAGGDWSGAPGAAPFAYDITVDNTDGSHQTTNVGQSSPESSIVIGTDLYGANGLLYESTAQQIGSSASAVVDAWDANGAPVATESFGTSSSEGSLVLTGVYFTSTSGSWTSESISFMPGNSAVSAVNLDNADGSSIVYQTGPNGTWNEAYYGSSGMQTEDIAYGTFYDPTQGKDALGTQVTDASGNTTFYAAGDSNAPTFTLPDGVPDDLTSAQAFWSNIISTTLNAPEGGSSGSSIGSAVVKEGFATNSQPASPGVGTGALQAKHTAVVHPHPVAGVTPNVHGPLIHVA